jgi:hypothetical protein
MKNVLLSIVSLFLVIGLTACGGDSSNPKPELDENQTELLGLFNSDFVFLPSYSITYEGGVLPISFMVSDYEYILDKTVMFVRNVNGTPYDYEFGSIMVDFTHNVAFIEADIYFPKNESNQTIDYQIAAYYLNDDKQYLIHAVNVEQSIFVPEIVTYDITVDMTNANSGYEIIQDPETGNVSITQSVSGLEESCTDMGWNWNQSILKCVPPEEDPTYQEVLVCINNPEQPNQWDFVTNACYAEIYPELDGPMACDYLGATWIGDDENGTCYSTSTASDACSELGGDWNTTASSCTLP